MLFAAATAAAHNKAEDNSAGDLSLVVATNAAVSADLAVSYTLGGTATPGTDYTISSGADYGARTGTFTIPSGTSAGIFVDAFRITAISDALKDSGETIVVTITDGAGYDPGTTDTTTITLFENTGDAAFEVSGAPVMGETLTVVQTVDDPDGNGTVQQYQWLRKSPDAQAWTGRSPSAARRAIRRRCRPWRARTTWRGSGRGGCGPGSGRARRKRKSTSTSLGSSFTATGAEDASGGSLALWGRAAHSTFDGREGTFSLDGEATTALLGADYARGDWLLGLALMQSEGDGGYADRGTGPQVCPDDIPSDMRALCNGAVQEGDGDVEASLTAAVPYAALQASERMKFWGAFGHGSGEVTLRPRAGGALASDITWTMASAGTRGDLLGPPREDGGLSLALVSDALWARTSSDRTDDLAASDSDVTRLRLGLEGRLAHTLEGGQRWTAEAAWGFAAFGGRFTASPHAGVGLTQGARDYTLGYRVVPARDTPALDVSFGVAATRSEREDAQADHTIGVEIGARW